MIEWRDEGTVLAVRPHGESSAIAEIFTAAHGRHLGLVRGGTSRKAQAALQPGTRVDAHWSARLADHLGAWRLEPVRSRSAVLMSDRLALAGLAAVTALLSRSLPERDAHAPLYARTEALLDLLGQGDVWPLAYLQWELALLEEMGFGLVLDRCAVTGGTDDLAYVSPRSGRAVSRDGAGDWVARLLPLPPVLRGAGEAGAADIVAALGTTGWFVRHRLIGAEVELPPARARLIDEIRRAG
ncbi:DNA repair protein RecO [Wenxinia marina]|uniref:DNA repair protein RecO n=1 Tax=Wenxinia marina DSM 24838 TaxID=1123501 RepID=A0A0D0P8V8_9RHOB|nr:DNA repair protein RecO [Wenxinia marina]KIQ68011.1 DNA replication and repair protein RecO [Wenxinia marina DSM 24838]GGL75413.1 DNA repair protein RecO [Wenxinia marina]